jgi:hypothetical protein
MPLRSGFKRPNPRWVEPDFVTVEFDPSDQANPLDPSAKRETIFKPVRRNIRMGMVGDIPSKRRNHSDELFVWGQGQRSG